MEKRYLYFVFVYFVLIFVSCKNEKIKSDSYILSQWIGKEIHFTENCEFVKINSDISELEIKPYKILVYVDSTGCTDCKANLQAWRRLMIEADSLMYNKLVFLFYFQSKNKREITYLLKRNAFTYPVYIDMDNGMNSINKFPEDSRFHVFLLDESNKILSLGNPVKNPAIWNLYKQIVLKDKH